MTLAPARKNAAALTYGGMAVSALTIAAVWLLGCTPQQSTTPKTGPVPEVAAQLSTVSAHVLRAQTLLAVETTPAAKLALGHLRVAYAGLPPPRVEDARRAEAMGPDDLAVEISRAAGLAADAAAALSDQAARAARKEAEAEFQRRERERASTWLLWAAGIMGAGAVACAVARAWVPLQSLLWSAGVLFATSASLVLAARLIAHDWLVYALGGALAVGVACAAVVAWRAYLAPSPRR